MNLSPYALEELLIWQASDLARKGHFSDAEAILLLFESSEGLHRSTAYGLLSNIFVQQKRYAEAKTLLQKAVALDPGNIELRDALEGLPYVQRRSHVRRLAWLVTPFLLIAVGLGTMFLIILFKPGTKPNPKSSQYSGPLAGSAAKTSLPKAEINNDWPEMSIVGLNIAKYSSEMRIKFDKGLFTDACQLSPESRPLLIAVADSLARSAGALFVIIEGHTDDLAVRAASPFRDNMNLGLMRAQTVLDVFKTGGFPASRLLAVSKGEEESPFANEERTRGKNRTVILRILAIR